MLRKFFLSHMSKLSSFLERGNLISTQSIESNDHHTHTVFFAERFSDAFFSEMLLGNKLNALEVA